MAQLLLGAVSLGLLWAVMTIGVYVTYRILNISDLTVEGSITLGAAIAAQAIAQGVNPYASLLLSFLGGMAAGLITGILHTKLKIPALLSGILTMTALWSVNLRVMGKANISLLRMDTTYTTFENLGMSKTAATIIIGLIFVFLITIILYWFFGTEIGCAIRATGNNQNMVRAQGINTNNTLVLGLMISNGFVAVSGGLIAQNQGFADIQMGTGAIVIGLASVIIGEVLIPQKNFYFRLLSLAVGAIIYRVIIALVLKAGMPANDLKLFTAITVAIALSLPTIKKYLNPTKFTLEESDDNAKA